MANRTDILRLLASAITDWVRRPRKGRRAWNRRVVRYAAGGYGIHEVHYRDGRIVAWSVQPSEATHAIEGPQTIGCLATLRADVEFTRRTSLRAIDELAILDERDLPGFVGCVRG